MAVTRSLHLTGSGSKLEQADSKTRLAPIAANREYERALGEVIAGKLFCHFFTLLYSNNIDSLLQSLPDRFIRMALCSARRPRQNSNGLQWLLNLQKN
jgi:hypothetical protein